MTEIKLVQKRNLWFGISAVIFIIGFGLMAMRALNQKPVLNFGVDFTGGTTLSMRLESLTKALNENPGKDVQGQFVAEIREILKSFNLENSFVQITGQGEVVIRTAQLSNEDRLEFLHQCNNKFGNTELLEVDIIGPTVGADMRKHAFWIIGLVSLAMMGYITFRFEWTFGIAALACLLHDALFMLAVASIFGIEVNTEFVAATLTILGYSINDTIVIFDRIRENLPQLRSLPGVEYLANLSIRQMFWRSLNTSLTVTLTILSLLFFGGTMIRPFAEVLLLGIIIGTYSSFFIASPAWVVIMLSKSSKTAGKSHGR